MKTHELYANPNGTFSLRQLSSGQVMHSFIGPWDEANQIYIEQSQLRDRLALGAGAEPRRTLVLWDVGLGLAANSLAAVVCAETLAAQSAGAELRELEIHSFENDPTGIATAIGLPERFPFFSGHQSKLRELLDQGEWISPDRRIRWKLHVGDFKERLRSAPPAELIYYDFYAPNTCPELWTVELFRELRAYCADQDPLLCTYVAATPVRVALLLAGFYVGYGRPTAQKSETSVASLDPTRIERPLGGDWLDKLERSHKVMPYDGAEKLGWDGAEVRRRIQACAQFKR